MQLNNYILPMKRLKSSIQTTFESEDLSGETSSTSQAHKGIKPKEISVSFLVPYEQADVVTAFYQAAEATDQFGDLVVYDITDRTANSANIRQVIFGGRIDQREMDELDAWQFSFRLKEQLSVAEKSEQRSEAGENAPEFSQSFDAVVQQSEQALA